MSRAWLGLLVATACGGAAEPDWAAQFAADPEATARRVAALDDPVAQEAAVIAIANAHPGASGKLCAELPAGPARTHCERFNSRPHLWTIALEGEEEFVPPNSTDLGVHRPPEMGPSHSRLNLEGLVPEVWPDLEPDTAGCADDGRRPLCQAEAARARATVGNARAAAAVCRSIEDTRVRKDCIFSAAEAVPSDVASYADALDLCLTSGTYAPECNGHVLIAILPAVNGRLDLATQMGETVHAAWTARIPSLADQAVARWWCEFAGRGLLTTPQLVGTAARELPSAAQPSVRDVAALYAIQEPDVDAAWDAMMAGAPTRSNPGALRTAEGWRGDLPGEEVFASTFYLSNLGGRRATSPDPVVDRDLSLLSAAAHVVPPRKERLRAALSDDREIVRWTAARLLSQLDPTDAALDPLAGTADDIVSMRVRGARFATRPGEPQAPGDHDAVGPPLPEGSPGADGAAGPPGGEARPPADGAQGPPLP